MSKRFELINFLNAHDNFKDNKNNKKLDSFDVVELLNHYDKLQTLLVEKDQRIADLEEQLKHAQKQLAIEELEFVLKNFRNRPAYFDVARQELCLSDQDKQFIDFINNRIKELGGGGENEQKVKKNMF